MTKKSIYVIVFLFICLIPFSTYGDVKFTDTFSFYGFLKLDAFYQDGGMNSVVAPRWAADGDGNTTLTATNTRFGFKWKGATIGNGWNIGAHLEWDLFSSSPNQMLFRTRHANFTLSKGSSKLLFGQFWDLFSPLGPTTLNTNGYFWQVGNIGFRRAQARYTYSSEMIVFAVSVNDPTSAGARKTNLPILQSRIGVNLGKNIKIGASGAYGSENHVGEGYETDVNIVGVCLDWNVKVSDFTIKGEFTLGQNLKNFLSRSYVFDDVAAMKFDGKKVNSAWVEAVYKLKKILIWGGYSFENLTDDDQMGKGELQNTSCIFAGVRYFVGGGASIGLEFSNYLSARFGIDEDAKTNQLIFSFIYGI